MKDLIVRLVDKLSEIGRTKGPTSPEFGQTLETLNLEFGRTLSVGTHVVPRGVQSTANGGRGNLSGENRLLLTTSQPGKESSIRTNVSRVSQANVNNLPKVKGKPSYPPVKDPPPEKP